MLKFNFKKLKFLRSLKVRIFLIVFIVGLIPSIVTRQAILQNYEERAVSLRTSDVQTQLKILANHLITYRYLQDTSSEVIDAELNMLSNLYDGRVLIINSNLRVVKDTYGISEGKTIISEEVIRCMKGENTSKYDPDNGYIEMTIPIMETLEVQETGKNPVKKDSVSGVMLTSVSTDYITTTMEILSRKALVVEVMVILAIFIVSVLASYVLIKPFEKITEALSEVKEGYTNDPISVPDCLETEHIGDAFNIRTKSMAASRLWMKYRL